MTRLAGPSEVGAWPLLLSCLAGISTLLGGFIAVSRKPESHFLATFLGLALGTVSTLAVVELILRNAFERSSVIVCSSAAGGLLAICMVQLCIPKSKAASCDQVPLSDVSEMQGLQEDDGTETLQEAQDLVSASSHSSAQASSHTMLRLGVVMAATLTIHNLPVGMAVAFSSFTDIGMFMALAVAVHNIPEGAIVAAPILAATGSKAKALCASLASGLAQPLGALLAMLSLRPILSVDVLHYILAAVGGVMLGICVFELWPSARRCKQDRSLFGGLFLGAAIMMLTIVIGS